MRTGEHHWHDRQSRLKCNVHEALYGRKIDNLADEIDIEGVIFCKSNHLLGMLKINISAHTVLLTYLAQVQDQDITLYPQWRDKLDSK